MKIQSFLLSIGLSLLMLCNVASPVQAKAILGLQPADEAPLDNRIPLVLIHGINSQSSPLYGWGHFLQAAASNDGFQSRYKSYFFIYPTADSVRNNGLRLQEALSGFRKQNADAKPFRVLALSMGGLVAKEALRDKALQQATDRVITLGSPFHGSPLANPEWIRAAVQQRSWLHPMRMHHRLAYGITRRKFPHFQEDFQWDNFDGSLPERLAILMAQTESELQANTSDADFGKQPELYTYAGFFGQSWAEEQWLLKTLQLESVPTPSRVKRRSLISRHMAFKLAQPCLASLSSPGSEEVSGLSLMRFNDGISPISSQLWLGRYIPTTGEISPSAQWQAVVRLKETHSARLFEGLDHRDWLTNRTRYHGSGGRVADWLHPAESPKTVFEWLLKDLEN